MSGFNLETSFRRMLPGFLLTGAGMSFTFGPMSPTLMRAVPFMLPTPASSLFTLFRRIGGNLGYALVASQVAHRTVFHRARLADHVTPYDPTTSQVLDGLTGRLATAGGLPPGLAEDSAIKLLDGTVTRHATMMAFNDVFWLMGMLFILTIPCLMFMSKGSGGAVQVRKPAAGQR